MLWICFNFLMLCFFILCSHPLHLPCHNLTSSPCSGIEPGKDRDAGKEGLDERMREASISAGQIFLKHRFLCMIAAFPWGRIGCKIFSYLASPFHMSVGTDKCENYISSLVFKGWLFATLCVQKKKQKTNPWKPPKIVPSQEPQFFVNDLIMT